VVAPAPAARRGEGGGRLLPRLLIFLPRRCSSRCGRGRASESSPRGRTEGAAPRLAAPPAGSGKSSPVGEGMGGGHEVEREWPGVKGERGWVGNRGLEKIR
jgi:hypothetical protein